MDISAGIHNTNRKEPNENIPESDVVNLQPNPKMTKLISRALQFKCLILYPNEINY